jgi:hypothetical protein
MAVNRINKTILTGAVALSIGVLIFAIFTIRDMTYSSDVKVLTYQKKFVKCLILQKKNCQDRLVSEYKRDVNRLYKDRQNGNFWISDDIDDIKEMIDICKVKVGQDE